MLMNIQETLTGTKKESLLKAPKGKAISKTGPSQGSEHAELSNLKFKFKYLFLIGTRALIFVHN
jgi:hypothetical protein